MNMNFHEPMSFAMTWRGYLQLGGLPHETLGLTVPLLQVHGHL